MLFSLAQHCERNTRNERSVDVGGCDSAQLSSILDPVSTAVQSLSGIASSIKSAVLERTEDAHLHDPTASHAAIRRRARPQHSRSLVAQMEDSNTATLDQRALCASVRSSVSASQTWRLEHQQQAADWRAHFRPVRPSLFPRWRPHTTNRDFAHNLEDAAG